MKKHSFYLLVLMVTALTSCSTYQYTARQVGVDRRSIDTKEQMVNVDVDYSRQVTSTSDYQLTRKDAIQEAEYKCINEQQIDVVVDPIFKVEYNPFKFKTRYKATIIGYAGTYKEEKTALDLSKEYTKEDIEKYKLLTDPNFAKFYYNKDIGDQIIIGNIETTKAKDNKSLVTRTINKKKDIIKPQGKDYKDALVLRNTGIGLLCGGVGIACGLGIPLLTVEGPGSIFIIGGCLAWVTGVPLICVGHFRMKKIEEIEVSLRSGKNGIGVGISF